MAQKKDWKSGFEGRYRRTSSPSVSPIRNSVSRGPNQSNIHPQPPPLTHHSSTKCLNTYNNSYSGLTSNSILSSSTMALTSYPSHASSSGSSSLSSSLSSSSSKSKSGSHLKHSVSSTSSSSNSSSGSGTPANRQHLYTPHIKAIPLDNENHVNNNHNSNSTNNNHINVGWPGHARQISTTVNFTSEELRAFRSRKAAGENYFQTTNRILPTAISTPTLIQPSYNSQNISSNQGSSSSLASASIETPPKISPSTSLRASLDSLHCPRGTMASRGRGLHDSLPRTVSVTENISNATESMSRCTSVAESLSRSTSIADSLGRSSSVAETVSSLSQTSSVYESIPPSPTTLVATGALVSDGAVMARPATVKEEFSKHLSFESLNTESLDIDATLTSCDSQFNVPFSKSPPRTPPIQTVHQTLPTTTPSSPLNSQQFLDSNFESDEPFSLPPQSSYNISESGSLHRDESAIPALDLDTFPPSPPSMPPPSDEDFPEHSQASSPTPASSPSPPLQPSPPATVTIGYGRSRRPEEVECDLLSLEYVSRLGLNPRLQALLGKHIICSLCIVESNTDFNS